jgi:hypothetical protein
MYRLLLFGRADVLKLIEIARDAKNTSATVCFKTTMGIRI